ncbi:MAG: CNNM domain-containing protein [bacterium]
MIIILKIALLFALLGMSAFFSGSETAFFSLSRFDVQRMNARNLRGASSATALLKRPSKLLVAILVGNMIVNISATTLMTSTLINLVGAAAVPIAVVAMTILVLIFGEITPKVFAVEHNGVWARLSAPIMSAIMIITLPVTYVLHIIQGLFLKSGFRDDIRLGEVDLRSALEIAHREGAIEEQGRDLLLHFLNLEHITAKQISKPISRVPILPRNAQSADAMRLLAESEMDYAFAGDPKENYYSMVEQEDLIFAEEDERVSDLGKKALLVDGGETLASLFQKIYGEKLRHIIVTDNRGKAIGVAAREDILSGIFLAPLIKGKPNLARLSKVGRYFIINGDMKIEDFNELFDVDILPIDQPTISDFLLNRKPDIEAGEIIKYQNLEFRIIRDNVKRIERIAVKAEE